jgi:hypothetical protein
VGQLAISREKARFIMRLIKLDLTNRDMKYMVSGRVNCDLTIVKASESHAVSYKDWTSLSQKINTFTTPGDHFTMIKGVGESIDASDLA